MSTGSLALVISGATLLLVVIVVAPFALCCFFLERKRDGESDRLVESNLPTITSKTATQRHSYGGASSWSPTKVKYSKRIPDPRPTSAPAKASNTGISRHEQSTHAQSIRSKYGLGNKMEKNTQALGERKEKLLTMEQKIEDLEGGAADFSSLADQLAKKHKKKKSKKNRQPKL